MSTMDPEIFTNPLNYIDNFYMTTPKPRESYRDYYRFLGDMIRDWSPVAVVPFGFVGNIFAFLVFSRPRMRDSITAFFFRLLAIFDTLHLAIEVLPQGLQVLSGVDMTRNHDWWCKTRYFFAYM